MAEDKDLDLGSDSPFNLSDDGKIAFDDLKDNGLDDFLNDDSLNNIQPNFNSLSAKDSDGGDDEIASLQEANFASFDIEDFDTALNSFQAARAGKVAKTIPMPPPAVKPQPTPKPDNRQPIKNTENRPVNKPDFRQSTSGNNNHSAETVSRPSMRENKFNPTTLDDSSFRTNSESKQQDILNWYAGELKEKCYEISADDMPEFLDKDKTIRIIRVNTDSCYGWNVFFDNGVFMNLHDLKAYQERHGEMPCQDGKIIYGKKTTNFERILKVVVYEKPHYFAYYAK